MGRQLKLESFLKEVVKRNTNEKFSGIFNRAKQNKDERLFLYDFIKKEFNLNKTFNKEELDIFFNNKSLSILDSAISNPYDDDDFWKFLYYRSSLKEEDKKSFEIVKKIIKTFNTYHNNFELSEDEIQEIIESWENEYDPLEGDPFDDDEYEEEVEPIIE